MESVRLDVMMVGQEIRAMKVFYIPLRVLKPSDPTEPGIKWAISPFIQKHLVLHGICCLSSV